MLPIFSFQILYILIVIGTQGESKVTPICLFGSFCFSDSDCLDGTTCYRHTDGSSQCLLDVKNEVPGNNCALPFQSCQSNSKCCSGAFFCASSTFICIPITPSICRNPDKWDSIEPTKRFLSVNVMDHFSNPWVSNNVISYFNTAALSTNAVATMKPIARGTIAPSIKPTVKTTSVPSKSSVSPTKASVSPTKASVLPTKASVSPTKASVSPTTVSTLPSKAGATAIPSSEPSSIPIPPPVGSGYFTTKGNQIIDSYGKPVRITGINWCGYDSPTYTLIGLNKRGYKDVINEMKSLGFNAFRIPFSLQFLKIDNDTFGIQYINYYFNPDLQYLTPIQTLDVVLEYCRQVNMRVILDRHSVFPNNYPREPFWYIPDIYPESKVIADLKAVASRYRNNQAMVGIDLWNEPKTYTGIDYFYTKLYN